MCKYIYKLLPGFPSKKTPCLPIPLPGPTFLGAMCSSLEFHDPIVLHGNALQDVRVP